MILQALHDYYERLAADPEADVAPIGYSRQKISFCVVLEPDGTLHAIQPVVREVRQGRPIPESMIVPGQAKPSGSGINPGFLWDNTTYMLGFKPDDPKPDRTQLAFRAFRQRHLDTEQPVNSSAFSAVCRFLESWNAQQAADHAEQLATLAPGFGVFRIKGEQIYIHELPEVNKYWEQLNLDPASTSDETRGICLVTGRNAPIARLHEPKVKGVTGGQSAGGLLVSFNDDAYTSYGKSQSYNAPVSRDAAFKYATALNRLLADPNRRVQLADSTVVFWTEQPTESENILAAFFGDHHQTETTDTDDAKDNPPTEDNAAVATLHAFWLRLREGKPAVPPEESAARFHVLALAPNAARISVRFWLVGTAGEFLERLASHLQHMSIAPLVQAPPDHRRILRETAREAKDIPPLLAGSLLRSTLTGGTYPEALAQALLRRIRADGRVTHTRAATLKAWLNRNHSKEVTVSLDTNRTDPAYLLGRLFAALEKVQKDALGEKLNTTIKDRFFSSASASPASVFPRLLRLSQHHLSKIENTGLRIVREKLIGDICSPLSGFPRHLNMQAQGLFQIGYYHQNRDLYTRKDADEITAEPAPAAT